MPLSLGQFRFHSPHSLRVIAMKYLDDVLGATGNGRFGRLMLVKQLCHCP
jgi:hypothetical protein